MARPPLDADPGGHRPVGRRELSPPMTKASSCRGDRLAGRLPRPRLGHAGGGSTGLSGSGGDYSFCARAGPRAGLRLRGSSILSNAPLPPGGEGVISPCRGLSKRPHPWIRRIEGGVPFEMAVVPGSPWVVRGDSRPSAEAPLRFARFWRGPRLQGWYSGGLAKNVPFGGCVGEERVAGLELRPSSGHPPTPQGRACHAATHGIPG